MKFLFSLHWALIASLWYFGNGVLHSSAVLLKHKGKYDRELLRLLMDGHVLMLSGAIAFVGWLMLANKISYGSIIGILVAAFMVVYCLMIWPFLKSVVTLAISLFLLIASIKALSDFPVLK